MVKDSGKWFPFHSALIFGDLASAKDLFERGNHRELLTRSTPDKGWRAIHFACHSGCTEAVSGFVERRHGDVGYVSACRRVVYPRVRNITTCTTCIALLPNETQQLVSSYAFLNK